MRVKLHIHFGLPDDLVKSFIRNAEAYQGECDGVTTKNCYRFPNGEEWESSCTNFWIFSHNGLRKLRGSNG